MKKKIVLFLCVMGIMTVLTGCSSGSKEIYTPQNDGWDQNLQKRRR